MTAKSPQLIEVLLVESLPAHREAAVRAFAGLEGQSRLHVLDSREKALSFLYRQGGYHSAPRPHVILLDPAVSGRNGWSIVAEVRADEELRRVPVVIQVTCRAEAELMKDCRLNDRFIVKPLNREAAEHVIHEIRSLSTKTLIHLHPSGLLI
jgi:CheY-like chemotaxis protein